MVIASGEPAWRSSLVGWASSSQWAVAKCSSCLFMGDSQLAVRRAKRCRHACAACSEARRPAERRATRAWRPWFPACSRGAQPAPLQAACRVVGGALVHFSAAGESDGTRKSLVGVANDEVCARRVAARGCRPGGRPPRVQVELEVLRLPTEGLVPDQAEVRVLVRGHHRDCRAREGCSREG